MKVKVKFLTGIRDLTGMKETEFSFHKNAIVRDILRKTVEDFPGVEKTLPYIYVVVNGECAELEMQLKENDRITLLTPLIGG